MDKPYDYFSIDDAFWIQIRPHLVSFGFKDLPKDVHLTISFHPDNPKINFHVTKNVGNSSSKPKISIVEIDKSILDQIGEKVSRRMLGAALKRFDLRQFTLDHRNKVGFISFDDIQKGKYSEQMENGLKNVFLPITTFPRKTRVKVKGDIGKQLEKFGTSKEYQKQLESYIVPVRHIPEGLLVSGMLITKKDMKIVLRINGTWYEFYRPDNLMPIVSSIVGSVAAKKLYRRYRRALVLVRKANTYQEVEQYDKPPFLYLKPQANNT